MSVPTVVAVIHQHRAALLSREQGAMAEQARRWLGVEQALAAQIDAAALELINNGDTTISQAMRARRWHVLMEQTRDELRKYEDYLEPRIIDGQRTMITQAIQHSAQAIDAVATQAQVVVPFNRLPVAAVESMVGLAGDGSPLRSVLDDAAGAGANALGQQLVNGVALGLNPREVARRAIRLGLGQSFTRMQAISRTEQLRVYRVTSLESYRNSRVVVGYKRLSARDDRVCAACLFADGNQYPTEYGFDEHVQGRCTMIPVLANVPPVRYETGQEWFRSQPESTQRAILGRGRFDLWQRGEASLDDMVSRDWSDTWGGSLRVTNVGRLSSGAGRVWAGGGPVVSAAPVAAPSIAKSPRFVTVKEAEAWAKANGATYADFKGMSIESAQNLADAIAATPIDVRPEFIGNYSYFQKMTGRQFTANQRDHSYGVSITYSSKIDIPLAARQHLGLTDTTAIINQKASFVGINTQKYKTPAEIAARKQIVQEAYRAKTGRDYFYNVRGEATAHHEIGHIVFDARRPGGWIDISNRWAREQPFDVLKDEREAFAEAWGAYHGGDSGRLPDYVRSVIEGIKNAN